jgi:hypothetical protein
MGKRHCFRNFQSVGRRFETRTAYRECQAEKTNRARLVVRYRAGSAGAIRN